MRIVTFRAGLGNQIFGYAFYLYLKSLFPKEKIYGAYWKRDLNEHNGLEIDKWFDVELPQGNRISLLITLLLRSIRIIGVDFCYDGNTRELEKPNAILFESFRMNKKYIPSTDWIKFKFGEDNLSDENKKILLKIHESESYFIHIRRGDYLSPHYSKTFANICGIDYYKKAISIILERHRSAKFFIFSDDMNWVKENLKLNNTFYVDWNQGKSSVMDLYLMSECKGGIMANSSFSFWGARLGREKELVIYPHKWDNLNRPSPDIFEDNWISI